MTVRRPSSAAGKRASEDLDHQPQSKSLVRLVTAEGTDGARRIAVKGRWIVRRATLAIEQPAIGARLTGDAFNPHLAFGRGASAKIEDQRAVGMRHTKGDRVGAQSRRLSARRSNTSGDAVGVDHQHGNQTGAGGLFGVVDGSALHERHLRLQFREGHNHGVARVEMRRTGGIWRRRDLPNRHALAVAQLLA